MDEVIAFVKRHFQQPDNGLMKIILLHVIVFMVLLFIKTVGVLSGYQLYYQAFHQYLCLPSSWETFLSRPWTIITYCFVHEQFLATIWGLLVLYTFGKILVHALGSRQFIMIYLLGGITGGLCFLLLYNIGPYFQGIQRSLVSFAANNYAVMTAAATMMPNLSLRLWLVSTIKIKYLVILLMLLAIVNLSDNHSGDSIVHLGGALLGYIYVKLRRSKAGFWQGFAWLKKLFQPSSTLKVTYHKLTQQPHQDQNDVYVDQKAIDLILDKVAKYGYESLTEAEKHQLFNAGK